MRVLEVELDIAGASAPTASAGRNGRIPTAAATPSPWKMSKTRCTVLYRESA